MSTRSSSWRFVCLLALIFLILCIALTFPWTLAEGPAGTPVRAPVGLGSDGGEVAGRLRAPGGGALPSVDEAQGRLELDRGLVQVLVVDETGRPRDDVDVSLLSGASEVRPLDTAGMWLVEGLTAAGAFVWLDDGRGDRRTFSVRLDDAVDRVVRLVLERQRYLDGLVIDDEGRRVGEQLLRAEIKGASDKSFQTEADGRFHLPWVKREDLLSVSPVGWIEAGWWKRFKPVPARVVSEEPLVLELQRCGSVYLHPTVTEEWEGADDREPVVIAVGDLEQMLAPRTLLPFEGERGVPIECGIEGFDWVRLGWGALRSECLLMEDLQAHVGQTLDVEMHPARVLTVQVVDAEGQPVEGCSLGFDRPPRDLLDHTARWDGRQLHVGRAHAAEAVTDERGTAELVEGVGWLRIGHPGYGVLTLDARAWCDQSELRVRFPRSRPVSGRVVWSDGGAVPGGEVSVGLKQDPTALAKSWRVLVDPSGDFRIPHAAVGPGTLRVEVSGDVVRELRIHVPEAGLDVGDIVLGLDPPEEILLDVAGDCALSLVVYRRDGAGRVLDSVEFTRSGGTEWRGRVPEIGTWSVGMISSSEGAVNRDFIGTIEIDQATGRFSLDARTGGVDVALSGGDRSSGLLLLYRLDGDAAAPDLVRMRPVSGAGLSRGTCLPLGSYAAVLLSAKRDGSTQRDLGARSVMDWQAFEVGPSEVSAIELTFDDLTAATVEVRHADGSPVVGAEIDFSPAALDHVRGFVGVTDETGVLQADLPIRGPGLLGVQDSGGDHRFPVDAVALQHRRVSVEIP